VITTLADHQSKSPSCAAINKNISSSNCTDQAVSDFVLLRESVYTEMTTSDHCFAEARDLTITSFVINEEDFGRAPDKHELMPEDQQQVVDDSKQRAHAMNIPEFPWDPRDPASRQQLHNHFQRAQRTCMDVQYRHCHKCNLKRLRTTVSGHDVCPNCPAKKETNETLLTFLIRYRYPDSLQKLTQAESAILSYYQPAIKVTYSQQDGKRYRLQHLILTKQPDKILKAITKKLPRKKLEDMVNIKTTVAGKEREMSVRTDRIKKWIEYLVENNQFYKEKYRTGDLQVDIEWFESTQVNNVNKIPIVNVGRTSSRAEDRPPPAADNPDSGDDEGSDNENTNDPEFVHLPQNETVGDTQPQTYISLNHDNLYQRANKMDMRRNDVIITEETVRVPVRDYLGVDFSAVRPNLYPDGQESPCHVRSHTEIKKALAALLHVRVKKSPEGPDDRYESEDWYPFEEDVIHAALVFAHAQNQEGVQNTRWFINRYPDTTRQEIDEIIKSMLSGPRENKTFDTSRVYNFREHLSKMQQTPQRWQEERKDIETVANDSGEANLFMTLNMDVRFWRDVHNILHLLIHKEPVTAECYSLLTKGHVKHSNKPCFIPDYVNDQKVFEMLTDRYAAKIEEYLYFRTQTFLDTWFHDVCGIPKNEQPTKTGLYETVGGTIWRRVEYTRSRGIQHWHILAKLPGVMHLPSLMRLLNRGRQARVELHKRNIKPEHIGEALHHVHVGFLAGRYLCEYADSLVHMDFTNQRSVGNVDDIQVLSRHYNNVLRRARCGEAALTSNNLPLLNQYSHVEGDTEAEQKRKADVAAFSCIHNCIQTACGGNANGDKCRFGFPRKNMPITVLGTICPNDEFTETHVYHKRSSTRTSNTNKWALLYWGANHDFQTIMNFSQVNRYATKYVTKQAHSDTLAEVLQAILDDQDAFLRLTKEGALIQAFTTANQYRTDLTRHQLFYLALGLPESVSNFKVTPASIMMSGQLKMEINEDGVEVPVDLLEKSIIYAYAERHKCTNAHDEFPGGIDKITLYDFLRVVKKHSWVDKNKRPAEKGYKNRDPNSENKWCFTFHKDGTARHIKIRNLKQSNLARNYSFEENEGITWDNMTWQSKAMLFRAHQELALFVPWKNSLDEYFLPAETYNKLNVLTTKTDDVKKERMEAFMEVYKNLLDANKGPQAASSWHRQNQYLYSMWLSNKVNKSVRENRAENNGVFSAKFAPGNPDQHLLDETNGAVYEFGDHDAPLYEVPEKGLEFELSTHLQNLPPKKEEDVHVVSANSEFWQKQQFWYKEKQQNSFLANPPPPKITVDQLTPQQHFAYTRATALKGPQVIYITGLAGTGKSAVAQLIVDKVKTDGRTCQVAAATAKAASQFNAPTFHGAMGISVMSLTEENVISDKTKYKLQQLYNRDLPNECTHFIIDEVNALSADLLEAADTVLRKVFNKDGEDFPWGGRRMIFLGDPLQLPPVKGVNLICVNDHEEDEFSEPEQHVPRRPTRVRKKTRQHVEAKIKAGQALFKQHLERNVIIFDKCHRASGLLPRIMDEVRNGTTTPESHRMIMCLSSRFPTARYDKGIYNDNNSRELMNLVQTVQDAQRTSEPLFVSFANYSVKHKTTERFLRSLKPQDFSSPVDDLLLLYRGMEVTLVKNLNTRAGLTNGTVGTVVAVCYEDKDVQPLLDGHHPQPYCVIVDFPEFKGFPDDFPDVHDDGNTTEPNDHDKTMHEKRFTFPVKTWVAIFPADFQLEIPSNQRTRAMFTKTDKKCRTQFPIVPAKNMTAHKSQGQTWPNCVIHIALGLKQIKNPTSGTTTLLYTAGTRSNLLKNCLFDHIPLDTWLNLGKSKTHQALLIYEQHLKEQARQFARRFGSESIYDNNLPAPSTDDLTADQQAEWEDILAMTEMPQYDNTVRQAISPLECPHITKRSNFHGVIAFDLGPRNTGVAVLRKPNEDSLKSAILELTHVDFGLPATRPANWQVDLYVAFREKLAFLRSYFEDAAHSHLTSWSVVVEYFNRYNSYTGSMLHTIERIINEFQVGTAKSVTVKACNTQMIHSSKSPIFSLNFTSDELRYLNNEIDLNTLVALKNSATGRNLQQQQEDMDDDDIPEPFDLGSGDEDVHMESATDHANGDNVPPPPTSGNTRASRTNKRSGPPLNSPVPPKRARRDATRSTKTKYKRQKEHSKRLMQLLARIDVDLSHLSIDVPERIRSYLRQLKRKLDDVGDAFLHACREIYTEPSNYRKFVPGQTLFQTNRCVAIRITVRWFLYVVLHVENQTVTIEHLQCHPTGITQKTNLRSIDPTGPRFTAAIPYSARELFQFQVTNLDVRDADTIHLLLRHTHGSRPHVMLQHLKSYVRDVYENHPDYSSTRTSLVKPRRTNYNFLQRKLVLIQETAGKHIDALQLLPTFLNLGKFMTDNSKHTENKLSEFELDTMYDTIVNLFDTVPQDQQQLTIDRLVIPRSLFKPFAHLSQIKTNNTHRENRASMWLMDLLLCALNNSVVRPHFKGHRGN
jgi:hypothetical protein